MFSEETELLCYSRYGKKILKLAYEAHQGIVKIKKFFELVFFWPGMDDATETIVKNYQACVVNQLLNKYTPLQPNLYLVVLE